MAFAELLTVTGMRLEEAASLLLAELPRAGEHGAQRVRLADAVCKGGRGRHVLVSNRVLRRVASYVGVERHLTLTRAAELGRRWGSTRHRVVARRRLTAAFSIG